VDNSHGEIPATIADAKGDLIVGTAADTVDRLAVQGTALDATITWQPWRIVPSSNRRDTLLQMGCCLVDRLAVLLVADSAQQAWGCFIYLDHTPTITSQGGSITTYTATGKYLKIDKGMFFIFTVTLSNVGTATGNMIITLPFTAVGSSAGSAYEYNTTGKGGPVSIANNASVAISRDSTFTTWFSNGWNLYASIFYEVA
jgi:hypothetical protein